MPLGAWFPLLAAALFKDFFFSHHAYSFPGVNFNTEGKGIVVNVKNNASWTIADAFSLMALHYGVCFHKVTTETKTAVKYAEGLSSRSE